LEIIGEAVNRIIKKDSDFPIKHAGKIIGTRNLPKLKSEIEELLYK